MSDLFRKARQNRIFQDAVSQIQNAILNGTFKSGDKLPSEKELGEMLEISRGTLREALRILEQKGLIQIKLGVNGGAFVTDTDGEQMSETLALLVRTQAISLEQLTDFREGVEGAVTSLAAKRISRTEIESLNRLLNSAKKCYEKGLSHWKEFVTIDEEIHKAIAAAAQNPLYATIVESIHDNIDLYYDNFLKAGESEMEENYQDLENMIKAITEGDAQKAAEIARDHIGRFSHHMNLRDLSK